MANETLPQPDVTLRGVQDADLPIFFEHQQDSAAVHMAAFTAEDPSDRAAFDAHWAKIRANENVVVRTILYGSEVVGNIASFVMFDQLQVSYWIGRDYWGKGIATQALTTFLDVVTERPIYGRAAKDNSGSIRVLKKCGFKLCGEEKGFANARGSEIDEVILELK